MTTLPSVNENSTSYIDIEPKDKTGLSVVPKSLSYRIDCVNSGKNILPETSLVPGIFVTITISPSLNKINNQANISEHQKVTVTGKYGDDDQVIEVFDYDVINLYAV